jgi:excisionase family DNA binding protein
MLKNARSVLNKRLLRSAEAADYLSVSVWTLRRLIQSGELPVVQRGDAGKFLVDIRDLDGFIERNKRTVGRRLLTSNLAIGKII